MTEGQKKGTLREQKRQRILDAAQELLMTHDYMEITLDHIAGEVGMTKTNFYNYFRSKEELFLDVIGEGFERSFFRLEERLHQHVACNDPKVFASAISEVTVLVHKEKQMKPLFLGNLVHKVSDEHLEEFQNKLSNLRLRLAKLFLQTLPSLTFFEAEQLVNHLIALKDGYSAEFSVSDRHKGIMDTLRGANSEETFESRIYNGIYLIARGMLADKES